MYAVIGHWETDAVDEEQFAHIVSVVKEQSGFVSGYWGRDTSEAGTTHAVVVLDSHANALAFRSGVETNIPSARMRVVEVLAHAA